MDGDPIHGWLRSLVDPVSYPSRGGNSSGGVDQKHGKRGQRTIDRDEISN